MIRNQQNKDYEDSWYLKSLYPSNLTDVYSLVSDTCDKLEYEKSPMYDEYPDKARIRKFSIDIFNELGYGSPTNPNSNCITKELIEILIINEFLHRRIRRRAFL